MKWARDDEPVAAFGPLLYPVVTLFAVLVLVDVNGIWVNHPVVHALYFLDKISIEREFFTHL